MLPDVPVLLSCATLSACASRCRVPPLLQGEVLIKGEPRRGLISDDDTSDKLKVGLVFQVWLGQVCVCGGEGGGERVRCGNGGGREAAATETSRGRSKGLQGRRGLLAGVSCCTGAAQWDVQTARRCPSCPGLDL